MNVRLDDVSTNEYVLAIRIFQRVVDCRSMFCKAARVMQLILFVGNVIEPTERVVEVNKWYKLVYAEL